MNAFQRLGALKEDNDATAVLMDSMRPRFERLRERHTNGAAPRAVSAFNLFQTPREIADMVASAAEILPGMTVLEPSAGLGRLILSAKAFDCGQVVAVEMDPECAGELFRMELEGVTIKQRDFLSQAPADLGLFDRIMMNPPFHMRADIDHIRHALKFLAPGGRLAAVCMNTRHRKEAFAGWGWMDLPKKAFRREGTCVPTALVTINQEDAMK